MRKSRQNYIETITVYIFGIASKNKVKIMLRHVILTQGRSGSNFLVKTLNQHPAIVNYGEVLGHWTPSSKILKLLRPFGVSNCDYLELLFDNQLLYYGAQIWSANDRIRRGEKIYFKHNSHIKSLGIKEFGIHFQRFQVGDFLVKNPDIAVIHLTRENLLQRYLSLESLHRRKIVSTKTEALSLGKMKIDVAGMLKTLDTLHQESEDECRLIGSLKGNPVLELRYEDTYRDDQTLRKMTRQVFEFLDVSPIDYVSHHRKILSRKLEDIVENHDELREALTSTRYAHYLD